MSFFLRNLISFYFLLYIASIVIYDANNSHLALSLYNLSLPLISALLILYRMKAVPILSTYYIYAYFHHSTDSFLDLSAQLSAALISQMIYYFFTGNRGIVSFGRSKLTGHRITWFVFVNSFLFILFNYWLEVFFAQKNTSLFFKVDRLINFQWAMNSCLTGIPFCYIVIRCIYKPSWLRKYIRRAKDVMSEKTSYLQSGSWLFICLLIMFCLVTTRYDSLIFTDYSLLWLLPIMLWGVMIIGYELTAPLWVIILILLSYYIDDYISQTTVSSYLHSLAVSSSMLFVFSLTIVVTGILTNRNRDYLRFLNRLVRIEYNTGLPSFQALRMDIKKKPAKCICHVRHPELNILEQMHGIEFRFEFIRALSLYIIESIDECDNVYYSPDRGVIIRFSDIPNIIIIHALLNNFRFEWKGYKLGVFCGLTYTMENNIARNLSNVVRALHAHSYNSLLKGKAIMVNVNTPGDNIINQATIRHYLQKAIDNQSFYLMVQPIVAAMPVDESIITTFSRVYYYEVLVRIKMDDGKMIFPDTILPIAQDAGLLSALDFTVIEQTFRFMNLHGESESNFHFSINITPDSLNKVDFLKVFFKLLNTYDISPKKITIEVIESDIIDNTQVVDILNRLREIGIKVAIDDFGTGSSSYSRLRSLDADILKIDGSFVRNILTDEFDFCAVRSFCEIAKLKKMEVVAEFVENESVKKTLASMGVDWLQGYHIGKPIPIENIYIPQCTNLEDSATPLKSVEHLQKTLQT